MKRRGITRGRILGATLLAISLLPLAAIADVLTRGPYTTWYNEHLLLLAEEAKLVGRPEADVLAILGTPSSVNRSAERDAVTYNYTPLPSIPVQQFQVHMLGGVVRGLELYDD